MLLRVRACGICRTDLHVADGDLPEPKLPLVLGQQIVAEVEEAGPGVEGLAPGERVGVSWLGWTCGECRYCPSGQENLGPRARFTGYQTDGGYAEYARRCPVLLADPRGVPGPTGGAALLRRADRLRCPEPGG